MTKRVAAIHDISCFGRCSMQVIWPVVSHFGHQVCPVPTALLSTHTGGYEGFSFLDLSDEMEKIAAHWKALGLGFDAIYSGFLGSERQIATVNNFIKDFSTEKTLVLVDPVMGDNGEIYKTYTNEMCKGMRVLCEEADIITPNLTEAYILLGEKYTEQPNSARQKELLDRLLTLSRKSKKAVILTGIHNREQNTIGSVFAIQEGEKTSYGSSFAPYCDCFFPGSGDLFASILLGKVLCGCGITESVETAVRFISRVSEYTKKLGTPPHYGLEFEGFMGEM